MRFYPGLAAAFFALTFAFAPALAQHTPPAAAPVSNLAPADEYFGHFRLSVLGITNTIRLAVQRLESGSDPHSVCDGSLAFASDSIAAWQQAYPRDPAIPRDLLALERAYLVAPSEEARAHALATEAWILRDYAGSATARTAEDELSGPQAARR
jgi:hypothetical protein